MPTEVIREGFAQVVAELVEQQGFAGPLSIMGVADDGSMFGVLFEREGGELNAKLVDDANRVARILFRMDGERVVAAL